jgi:hypothetical protein
MYCPMYCPVYCPMYCPSSLFRRYSHYLYKLLAHLQTLIKITKNVPQNLIHLGPQLGNQPLPQSKAKKTKYSSDMLETAYKTHTDP